MKEKEKIEEKLNEEPFKETNNNYNNNNGGKLVVILIIVGCVLGFGLITTIVFARMFSAFNFVPKIINRAIDETSEGSYEEKIDKAVDKWSEIVEKHMIDEDDFNDELEEYFGTKEGNEVIELIDKIALLIKKDKEHTITVQYNQTKTNNPDEITKIKKQIIEDKKYEVSMDYDSTGYINSIKITDY